MVTPIPKVVLGCDRVNYLPLFTFIWGDVFEAWQPIYGRFLFTEYSVRWT